MIGLCQKPADFYACELHKSIKVSSIRRSHNLQLAASETYVDISLRLNTSAYSVVGSCVYVVSPIARASGFYPSSEMTCSWLCLGVPILSCKLLGISSLSDVV